ncbi:MAG: hypothetical protein NUV60_00955 [Patescibacteria group bacterium]|nr:hypothetical protein [Patescibacteria group bacterium]
MAPNRRYLKGFVVAVEDSRDFGDSEKDYLIRRLIIEAEDAERDCGDGWDMIAVVEVEVCDTAGESGIDAGYLEAGPEVYRTPFPENTKLRKDLIRLWKEHPKFFQTDTWGRLTNRHQPSPA